MSRFTVESDSQSLLIVETIPERIVFNVAATGLVVGSVIDADRYLQHLGMSHLVTNKTVDRIFEETLVKPDTIVVIEGVTVRRSQDGNRAEIGYRDTVPLHWHLASTTSRPLVFHRL
jgi:hypothetical protein